MKEDMVMIFFFMRAVREGIWCSRSGGYFEFFPRFLMNERSNDW